ncbi:hypothetical protein F4X90_08895 [Candidatus Poribacteria bacterium]|nr:hypothetical protein [Candidatus Poribacteria bacterium]
MSEKMLTTIEDLLSGYQEKDFELSTGKVFTIQSFTPGNLLIDVGSPIVELLTDASEEDLRQMPLDLPNTRAGRAWSHFEQIVCDNVTSIRFSPEAQNMLPTGLVSIRCLTLGEIRELYVAIRDLSVSPEELESFREAHKTDEEPEQSEVDTEDSEDGGEES